MRGIWIVIPVLGAFALTPACKDAALGGGAETLCSDGVDNDRDGDMDCADTDCADAPECVRGFVVTLFSEDLQRRGVDILLVLDNSGATDDTQERARMGVMSLVSKLREREDGLPDLHVGVTSTDLGAGGYPITYCEDPGDEGNLIIGSCIQPTGVPFIIDLQPQGCLVERAQDGACSAHDCTQANCAEDQLTTLEEDWRGCPRCRSFSGETFGQIFNCVGTLGTMGCGFEQPLEAMYRALNNNPNNTGFLRDDAHLVVVLAADEDDCSVADPYFFDSSDVSMDSELGPLTSYRCFEWGVTCDINDRDHVGLRENCVPRDDPDALLHPLSRYTQVVRSLKREEDFTIAVLAGPVENGAVMVGHDDMGFPELQSAEPCYEPTAGVRLKAFAEAMNAPQDWWWAFTMECLLDNREHFEAAGERVLGALGDACAPYPPLGCTDVAVEFGFAGDGQACNDECRPSCVVTDVFYLGTPQEIEADVVHCLEVCPSGACPGNTNRASAYESGHPAPTDASLPVSACWQVRYEARCVESNGAKLVVSRREAMPPRSVIYAACNAVAATEMHCADGEDNDGDCLVDSGDPDCGGPASDT